MRAPGSLRLASGRLVVLATVLVIAVSLAVAVLVSRPPSGVVVGGDTHGGRWHASSATTSDGWGGRWA